MEEEVKLPEELRDVLADAKVMCRIGQAYLEGFCLKRDSLRGVYWLRQAANMDCPDAIEALATCYEKGTGVIANATIAEKLHARAARLRSALRAVIALVALSVASAAYASGGEHERRAGHQDDLLRQGLSAPLRLAPQSRVGKALRSRGTRDPTKTAHSGRDARPQGKGFAITSVERESGKRENGELPGLNGSTVIKL